MFLSGVKTRHANCSSTPYIKFQVSRTTDIFILTLSRGQSLNQAIQI